MCVCVRADEVMQSTRERTYARVQHRHDNPHAITVAFNTGELLEIYVRVCAQAIVCAEMVTCVCVSARAFKW